MIRTLIRSFFIFLLFSCYGCSGEIERLPGIDIPLLEMNQDIQLLLNPGGGVTPRNNEGFDFQIKNLSEQEVIFPGDYGVKLYIQKEGRWVEVENTLHYSSEEVILPLAEKFSFGLGFFVIPYIPDMNENVVLRVAVTGYLVNDVDKNVGAYTDIILEP